MPSVNARVPADDDAVTVPTDDAAIESTSVGTNVSVQATPIVTDLVEPFEAREETHTTVESLVNLGEARDLVEPSEAREEAHGVIGAGVELVEGDDLSSVGMSSCSTPMSQRSAGSVARHQAHEAMDAELTLLRAALEATLSAGESARKVAVLEEHDRQQAAELSEQAALAAARKEESARKVAALGMGVSDGAI